jgi:hypothetical protein
MRRSQALLQGVQPPLDLVIFLHTVTRVKRAKAPYFFT